jgi:hypothetical protein
MFSLLSSTNFQQTSFEPITQRFYSFLLVPHIWLRCIGTQINLAHEHKIQIQKAENRKERAY